MARRPKPVPQMTVAQFEAAFPDENRVQELPAGPPLAERHHVPALRQGRADFSGQDDAV